MKKVAIIGSSMAGASLALLLSKEKGIDVKVYELKPREEIGHKLCSNICTEPVESLLKRFGLNPSEFILKTYTKLKIFTRSNSIEFPIKEHELDRVALAEALISSAKRYGAKFHFSTKFVSFKKAAGNKGFEITFEKEGKQFTENADFLVGSDGAVSEVARKAGLWKKRKHFLYLQGKVGKEQVSEKFAPEKNTQHVFVGEGFGYYSYIYPSGEGYSVGFGTEMHQNVRKSFDEFAKYAGVSDYALQGALIPMAKLIGRKKNLFVIGDAGCQTKFSLGGIIPSMMAAEAIKDIIADKDYSRHKALRRKILVHQIATKILRKLNDADFNELFEIMKDPKYSGLMAARDRFGKKEIALLFSPKLAWFSLRKLILR